MLKLLLYITRSFFAWWQEANEIEIIVQAEPEHLFHSIHELVRMAFPGSQVRCGQLDDKFHNFVLLQAKIKGEQLNLHGCIRVDGKMTEDRQNYRLDAYGQETANARWISRVFVYRLLCRHCDHNFNAYGVLTGVRPVKLVHRMLDKGLSANEVQEKLKSQYLITYVKAKLLTEVALNSHPYLEKSRRKNLVGIYIGVPLCPSRCTYCSFPGAVLHSYEEQVTPFVQVMLKELNIIGDALHKCGLKVESIYIGGGTPTILSDLHIMSVFELLQGKYISDSTREITLEAGRPDTLSLPRMKMFKNAGVTRVCINPQTMNDKTLRRIARQHTSADIVKAVEWVREAGFRYLNMDLIAGLPGENIVDYKTTVEKILELRPENITIHTLAVKKGSDLSGLEGMSWKSDIPVKEGITFMQEAVTNAGYHPYYLYRQKYMRTDAENVGYSLPGRDCLFNIQMIEERQTIIGIGGGAASKFIDSNGKIVSIYNPSDPISYCLSAPSLAGRKVDNLRALN